MSPKPTAAAEQHLRQELGWLRALLELRLRSLQAAGILPASGSKLAGTHVPPEELDGRLAAGEVRPTPEVRAAADRFHQIARARDANNAELAKGSDVPPLMHIERAFQLDQDDYLLLLLCVAPSLDPTFGRLYAFLQNHFDRQYATLALVADVLVSPDRVTHVATLLAPGATLVRHALIVTRDARADVLPLFQPISVEPRILAHVLGGDDVPDDLQAYMQIEERPETPLLLGPREQERWQHLAESALGAADRPWDCPLWVLTGPAGAGKHRWAGELAATVGRRLLRVDLVAMREAGMSAEQSLRMALREGLLLRALPCLAGWDELVDAPVAPDGPPRNAEKEAMTLSRVLDRAIDRYPSTAIVLSERHDVPLPRVQTRAARVARVEQPGPELAALLWDRYLPPARRDQGLATAQLVEQFDILPGPLLAAVRDAETAIAERRSRRRRVHLEDLDAAVRRGLTTRMGSVARLVPPTHRWEHLIVPAQVAWQLAELVNRHRHKNKVLRRWGLNARFGDKLGLSVLFEGPPGTGKTMSASLVAQELGLELFQIDLSQVVSKWIGESEKQLARIFAEAERSRCMLLFDEADSLFGRRTEVSSSTDRYANLEVNFLLQRLEQFTGVAVLTTNFPEGLDDAFKRRLAMRVTFPKPGAPERERLWRTMLAAEGLPLAERVDFGALARDYELSGGLIRNAALRAAFMAASRDIPLGQGLLDLAARIEMREQGFLVKGSPYGDLAEFSAGLSGISGLRIEEAPAVPEVRSKRH